MAEPEAVKGDPVKTAVRRRRFVPTRVGATFVSLQNRNYRYLWYGQVGAATAMHADLLARSLLTYDLTQSSAAVGAVNLVRAAPMLALGLFGGVVADRFDRRKVLMAIQAWSFMLHVAMAVVILTGHVQLWHVYVLAFLLGIGMAMNQPVRTSIIPQLVPREHMLNAVSLNSIAINGTRMVGPALIGLVIAAAGFGPAYVVSSAAYAIVIMTTFRINMPPVIARAGRGNMVQQLFEGFRYIGKNRLVLALVLLGMGPLAIGFSHQTLLPALVVEVLNSERGLMGAILSVGAVGGLGGGLYMASRGDVRHKGIVMLAASSAYGLALLLFAGVTVIFMVFPLMMMIGVSQTIFRSANTATLMESTPDHLRGRIMSVTMLDTAMAPVAGLIAGIVADQAGVPAGYILLGSLCLFVVALSMLLYPRIRRV